MSRAYLIIGGIALIIAIIGGFFWYQKTEAKVGVINIYEGTVGITKPSGKADAKNGTPVFISDILEVAPKSRASLTLEDGSIVRLEAGTEVKISELSFQLIRGRMWSSVKPLPQGGSFEVETPTLVAAVRGTSFDVSYSGGRSRIYVGTGTVLASLLSNLADIKKVERGFALEVSDDNSSRDFNIGPRPALPDEWIKFNLTLDKNIGQEVKQEDRNANTIKNINPVETKPVETKPDLNYIKKNILPVPPVNIPVSPSNTIVPKPTVSDTSKKLAFIIISPDNALVTQNETLQFNAKGVYGDGTTIDLTSSVLWQQKPLLGIFDSTGKFHADVIGRATIFASFEDVNSNLILITVKEAAAKQ